MTKVVMPLEQASNQTITFDGNFRLCLMSPFLIGISTISWPDSIILRVIETIDVKELLIRQREFLSFLLFENLFGPNLQMFFRLTF